MYRMITTLRGNRQILKFSLGAVLAFFLASFFAAAPALAIERFRDAKGTIHISNIPSKNRINQEAPKEPQQVALSPVEDRDPGLPLERLAAAQPQEQGIEVEPARNTLDAFSPTLEVTPPVPAPSQEPLKPPPPPEETDKDVKSGIIALVEESPAQDGTIMVKPEPHGPAAGQVLRIKAESMQEEPEAEEALEPASNNNIWCYWNRGVLRITNVSVSESVELAWRPADNRRPGKSAEAWSDNSPEIRFTGAREENWAEPRTREPARVLAAAPGPGSQSPRTIRTYRDSGRVLHIDNREPEDYSVTVSA